MGLNLNSDSRAAVDLAKRAVPDGAALDTGLLMDALYHATSLKERLPQLAPYLKQPQAQRNTTPAKVPLAESLQPVFEKLAQSEDSVSPEDLFLALLSSDPGRGFLLSRGITEGALSSVMAALAKDLEPAESAHGEEVTSGWRHSVEREEVIRALSTYGRMLTVTEPPHKGVVQLEAPLKSLIRTLSKMKRKNAIIIGYPGTGKSALVYELARRLVQRHPRIPAQMRELDIFELSPSFLRSGASMVGQYDERVKALIEILRAHPQVILFVDEIHSLFHSSMHEKTPFSEANESFKAVLGRGEISCIGCTTTAEYRHYIEPDGALTRRFGIIRIEPPSRETTIRILQARRPKMEQYFALRIPDEMLERAAALTEDFLPGRFQPDKSIQLLDEACAHCVTSEPPLKEVTEEALWRALEDTIGHSLVRTERITEADVYEQLHAKIIGQDQAIRGIARAFVAALGGWAKQAAPRGVFLFCGPTGVGKTETAVILAKILGSGRENLLRVDCNTLQGSGYDSGPAINRLLGVPRGYVGYARGEGGILSKVRDMPESIVLFDEIEKADPGVGKLLLQILDDGRVEDVEGNLLDFRRSFIIFTTNAGCVYDRKQIGFEQSGEKASGTPRADVDALKVELRALGYGEEFLGRITQLFVFNGLECDAIQSIIQLQLERLRAAAEVRGHQLEWNPEIVSYLASQWQPRFGVRHLTTILGHRISEQLGVAEVQGELKGVKLIRLEVLAKDGAALSSEMIGLAMRERQGETLVIKLA